MNDLSSDVNLYEFSDLILSLKKRGLSDIAEYARESLKKQIDNLPSREKVFNLNKRELIEAKKDTEEVLDNLVKYAKMGKDYKSMYEMTHKLPTSDPILIFNKRNDRMNKYAGIKQIIKISSDLDNQGKFELSDKTLIIAENLDKGKINDKQLSEVISSLQANGLQKEAQFFQKLKDKFKGVAEKVFKTAFGEEVYNNMVEAYQQGVAIQEYQKQLNAFSQELLKLKEDMANSSEAMNEWYDYIQSSSYVPQEAKKRMSYAKGSFTQSNNYIVKIVDAVAKSNVEAVNAMRQHFASQEPQNQQQAQPQNQQQAQPQSQPQNQPA